MAATGPGNSGGIDFSLCKTRVYAVHCGDMIMSKSPAPIPAVTYCEITPGSLDMESKAPRFQRTAGTMLGSKHDT